MAEIGLNRKFKNLSLKSRKMSFTECYAELLKIKNRRTEFPANVILKVITNKVLQTYDLRPLKTDRAKLDLDTPYVSLGYNITDPVFNDRYTFTLTFGLTSEKKYHIHLTRARREKSKDPIPGRTKSLTRTVTINPNLIPTFRNRENDIQNLIKIMDMLISKYRIIVRPPSDNVVEEIEQPAPANAPPALTDNSPPTLPSNASSTEPINAPLPVQRDVPMNSPPISPSRTLTLIEFYNNEFRSSHLPSTSSSTTHL